MELRHLHYVIVAAEQRSFRRAARSSGIQESTISRGIRDLEDEIGVALFIRNHAGVKLTHAGQKFLSHARKVTDQVIHATRDAGIAGRGEDGMVRIGIFTSLASGFIAELLHSYTKQNPGIRPDLFEGGPAGHITAVREHRLDVAFLTGQPAAKDCGVAHLWDERVFVALSQSSDLTSQAEVSWQDLQDRHFIVSETDPGPEIHDYLIKHLAD